MGMIGTGISITNARKNTKTYFFAALLADLGLTKGTGTAIFIRASASYTVDQAGHRQKMPAGAACFPGMRVVKNLLTYSEDCTQARSVIAITTTATTIVETAEVLTHQFKPTVTVEKYRQYLFSLRVKAGPIKRFMLRENSSSGHFVVFDVGTGAIIKSSGATGFIKLESDGSYTCSVLFPTYSATPLFGLFLLPDNGSIYADTSYLGSVDRYLTVLNLQLEDVTNRTNQNPSEYLSVGVLSYPYHGLGVDGIKAFPYLNPYTVDGNGVVTDSGVRTPISGTKGLLIQPATTNKCTCWGVPRADAYGTILVTGNAVKGKIYEIVARVSLDWGTVATLISGTANTVGAKYIITGALTFTATETGKECIYYIGTKAYHDGTVFQNPIAGMTLSGDTAAVLSIAADQAAIDSAIASEIAKGASAWDESLLVVLELARDNGYKSYDITTGAGGAGVVTYTGAMEAVATSMAETIRVLSGSCTLSDTSGTYTVTPTGTTYARAKKENFTPAAGATMKLTVAASSQVRCLAPQVESLPFATMATPSEGASMSRAADILSYPLAGTMPLTGKRHIPMIYWTPRAVVAGRSEVIAYSGTSSANCVKVVSNGTSIRFEKIVASVSEAVTLTITPVAGTTYAIDPWINADNTIGLKVNAVVAGTNTSTTVSPVFGTSMYVGSDGTNAINGQVMSLKITDGTTYPAGELEMLASLEMLNNLWMI